MTLHNFSLMQLLRIKVLFLKSIFSIHHLQNYVFTLLYAVWVPGQDT